MCCFPPQFSDTSGDGRKLNWVVCFSISKDRILWSSSTQHLGPFDPEGLNKGPKRVPQKECVCSIPPVSCRQNWGGEDARPSFRGDMQIQKAAAVGTWQVPWMLLMKSDDFVKIRIGVILPPKDQPNGGRPFVKEQRKLVFKVLAAHQRGKVSCKVLWCRHSQLYLYSTMTENASV